jgi:predicted nucleic acid-binding Zn ribbon protein
MSAGAFSFKGSGFYQTDYKAAPACEKKSADSPACATGPSAQA